MDRGGQLHRRQGAGRAAACERAEHCGAARGLRGGDRAGLCGAGSAGGRRRRCGPLGVDPVRAGHAAAPGGGAVRPGLGAPGRDADRAGAARRTGRPRRCDRPARAFAAGAGGARRRSGPAVRRGGGHAYRPPLGDGRAPDRRKHSRRRSRPVSSSARGGVGAGPQAHRVRAGRARGDPGSGGGCGEPCDERHRSAPDRDCRPRTCGSQGPGSRRRDGVPGRGGPGRSCPGGGRAGRYGRPARLSHPGGYRRRGEFRFRGGLRRSRVGAGHRRRWCARAREDRYRSRAPGPPGRGQGRRAPRGGTNPFQLARYRLGAAHGQCSAGCLAAGVRAEPGARGAGAGGVRAGRDDAGPARGRGAGRGDRAVHGAARFSRGAARCAGRSDEHGRAVGGPRSDPQSLGLAAFAASVGHSVWPLRDP